jgi:hypothetical protein
MKTMQTLMLTACLALCTVPTQQAAARPRAPQGTIQLTPRGQGQRFGILKGQGVRAVVKRLNGVSTLTTYKTPRGRVLAHVYRNPHTTSVHVVGKRGRAIERERARLGSSLGFQRGRFAGGWDLTLAAGSKAALSIEVGNRNITGQATVTTQRGRRAVQARQPVPTAIEQANRILLGR